MKTQYNFNPMAKKNLDLPMEYPPPNWLPTAIVAAQSKKQVMS